MEIKNNLIDRKEINDFYSFTFEHSGKDHYFCNCGNHFVIDNLDEISDEEKENKELFEMLSEGEGKSVFDSMIKDAKLSLEEDVICPSCDKNFSLPQNRGMLIPVGKNFLYGFNFEETEELLVLYLAKANTGVSVNNHNENDLRIDITESIRYLSFNKKTNEIVYQDFGDSELEKIDLHQIIDCVNRFFKLEEKVNITNFFNLHLFVNRLANFVSDTENSNIAEEFLANLRGVNFDTGLPFLKKLFSIFLGITQYSNLSTIALTKSSQFLYDLMLECEIPSAQEMIDSKATSPVKIFNFLVNKYVNKLNEEVNEDNKEAHNFKFKSKSRIKYENELNETDEDLSFTIEESSDDVEYLVRNNKEYKSGKVVKVEGQGYKVLDSIEDGTISKFIYKNIEKFSQYKQLIKYFKFYDKNQLINLMRKYDIDYLAAVIDVIYFRKRMDIPELERVLDIIYSFLEERFVLYDLVNINKYFSFVEYDDTKLMMDIMEFDPKREFNKIRTYSKLVDYHDNLVKFYKVKTDEEKNGKIGEFVSKFRYLEEPSSVPLRIVLHDKPELIIKEGVEMRHSAAAYASNVSQGSYLLASVFDEDPNRPDDEFDRFTIGFTYQELNGLEFDQVKSYGNKLGSDRFKKMVMQFLEDKDVSYRPIKDLKISIV